LIASRYPPRIPVDLDDVADMLSVIADGGIILSRAVNVGRELGSFGGQACRT